MYMYVCVCVCAYNELHVYYGHQRLVWSHIGLGPQPPLTLAALRGAR